MFKYTTESSRARAPLDETTLVNTSSRATTPAAPASAASSPAAARRVKAGRTRATRLYEADIGPRNSVVVPKNTLVAAGVALLTWELPYKLGLIAAALAGIVVGVWLERRAERQLQVEAC